MLDCLKNKKNYEVKPYELNEYKSIISANPCVEINEITFSNILSDITPRLMDKRLNCKTFIGCSFTNIDFFKFVTDMKTVRFKNCSFHNCCLISMVLCRFIYCQFIKCLLINLNIDNTYFELSNIYKCDFNNSVFKESGMILCNFNDNKVCNSEMNGLFIDYSDIRNNNFEVVQSIYRTREKTNNDPHLISW